MPDARMLEVTDLAAERGGVVVIRDISLSVTQGETVALLGTNGAGKSTTVDAICGLAKKRRGNVRFVGDDITRLPPHKIARRGLLQVSQDRDLFPQLSVEENLQMGLQALRGRKRGVTEMERVLDRFPILRERRRQVAGSLSGGEQRMLAIARALVGEPSLLLLDEPSSGLAPIMVEQVGDALRDLAASGQTILLVEQNIGLALEVCHRFVVLRAGEKVYDEPKSALGNDPREALASLYM